MLWPAFFATGEARLIQRRIDVPARPEAENALPVAAAEWSLTSNAAWHPLVLGILKMRRQNARGELRETLDKILSKASR